MAALQTCSVSLSGSSCGADGRQHPAVSVQHVRHPGAAPGCRPSPALPGDPSECGSWFITSELHFSVFFFFFFPLPHFIFDTSTKSGGVIIRREATILYSARKKKKKKKNKQKKKDKVPPSSLKITAGSSNRKLVRFTSLQLTDASVDTRSASSLLDNPRQQRSSSSAASPRRFALNSEGVVLGKLIF